jgi:hypothetical protein
VSESLQIWLSGAGVSEETERVGSDPKGNGAGIDPTAVALVMTGASRERVDAFLKDQQEPIAVKIALGGGAPELQGRFICSTE